MNTLEFRKNLEILGLNQVEFARLVGVTARSISLWVSQEIDVPSPVAAYLNLLVSLPKAIQEKELSRLKQESNNMYEGMYRVMFEGQDGEGFGMVTLSRGALCGIDVGGVQYDGTYEPSANKPGYIDTKFKLSVPPGVSLVQGVPPQPMPYSFDLNCSFAARGITPLSVETPFGPVQAKVEFMRAIPN
jgi:hypothetical protein